MGQQETDRSRFLNRLLCDQEAGELLPVEGYVRQFDSIAEFVLEEYSVLTRAAQPPADQDRFEEELELGRGGMGRVQLVRDQVLNRQVVLKTLHIGQQTPSAITRLQREAQALGGLDHPDVCPILDVVERDGNLTLVLPYLRGETLEVFIKRSAAADPRHPCVLLPGDDNNAPLPRLLTWLARVADAVEVVHGAGFVHRDLKPANLLVREDGSPTVIDFGLALASANEDQRLTLSGDLVGTPLYMAPEQIEGRECDVRTDVYALGIVLHEALVLERPFEGKTREATFHQILTHAQDSVRSNNRHLSRDLEAVCSKAMARDPKRRYATAGEFAADLRRVVQLEPTQARPDSGVRKAMREVRRRPGRAAAVLLGFVGVFLGANYFVDQVRAEEAAWNQMKLLTRLRHEYLDTYAAREDTSRPLEQLTTLARSNTPWALYVLVDVGAFHTKHRSDFARALGVLSPTIDKLRESEWGESERLVVRRLGVTLANRPLAGTRDDVLGWALIERAQTYTRMGRLEDAEVDLTQARDLMRHTENYHRETNAIADLADVVRRLGREEEAAEHIAEAKRRYREEMFHGEMPLDGPATKPTDSPGGVRDVELLRTHIDRRNKRFTVAASSYYTYLDSYLRSPPGGPFSPDNEPTNSFVFVHVALLYAECILREATPGGQLARCLDYYQREFRNEIDPGVTCHYQYVMMLKDWLASRNAYQAMVTADKIEGIWSQQQRYSKYYFDLDLFRAEVLDEVNIEVPILEISRHATLSTHVIVTDRNPDERTHQPNSGPEQDVLTDLRQSKSPGFLVHRQVLDGPTEDRLKEFGWTIVARLADCLPQ